MFKIKISTKVLIYFVSASILPLVIVNTFLIRNAKKQLLSAATLKQQIIANNTASDVDTYLSNRINNLVTLSQIIASHPNDNTLTEGNIAALVHQEKDISRVSVIDGEGGEVIVFSPEGKQSELTDQSKSDEFKFVKFSSGKTYVSSVSYDSNNNPSIIVAVPVFNSNYTSHLNNLSQADFGSQNSNQGLEKILVAKFNINDLWQSVLSTKIGKGGYAYVVDGLGNLVAHPDKKYLAEHNKIPDVGAVKQFINGDLKTRDTTSETGVKVISTPRKLTTSQWAVIVQEPVSSIYATTDSFIRFTVILMVSAGIIVIVLSLILSKQFVNPIRKLTEGAQLLGTGHFDQKINIHTKDELQELADTFNKMGSDIRRLINDLKQKNTNMVVEQLKLSRIINSVTDGVIALNTKDEIITINPPAARLISRQVDDLTGKTVHDLYKWKVGAEELRIQTNSPGIYHYKDVVIESGGKQVFLDLMISTLEENHSDVSSIITIHDLTPSHELESMKLDFVSIAAHELRTPLTVVRGYLNLLSSDALKELSVYNIQNLQRAVVGAEELSKLINNLLNVSRIERGKLTINREKVDIANLVKEIVLGQQVAVKPKDQSLTYDGPKAHVSSPIDKSAIGEVVQNLISNAVKYTPANSEINVHLSVRDKSVYIEVHDNGPGIPEKAVPKLFTKFFRAEQSMTSGNRGTGLGLYISKRIVEMHGGQIGVHSRVGEGSTFYLSLPLYDEKLHGNIVNSIQKGVGRGWITKRAIGRG